MASNTDMTIPTATGVGPGNGTLVRLVAEYAEREPQVAGKPMSPLFEETITRVGGDRPLVVGDRLDTDIEGAVTMGWDSLLVLTGVTGLEELVRARKEERPTYIAPDLAALGRDPAGAGGTSTAGSRSVAGRATVDDGRLTVDGRRDPPPTGGGSSRSRRGAISTRRGSLSQPMACSLPCSVSAMSESFVNPIFGGHEEPATELELERRGRTGRPGTPRSTRSSHR